MIGDPEPAPPPPYPESAPGRGLTPADAVGLGHAAAPSAGGCSSPPAGSQRRVTGLREPEVGERASEASSCQPVATGHSAVFLCPPGATSVVPRADEGPSGAGSTAVAIAATTSHTTGFTDGRQPTEAAAQAQPPELEDEFASDAIARALALRVWLCRQALAERRRALALPASLL